MVTVGAVHFRAMDVVVCSVLRRLVGAPEAVDLLSAAPVSPTPAVDRAVTVNL